MKKRKRISSPDAHRERYRIESVDNDSKLDPNAFDQPDINAWTGNCPKETKYEYMLDTRGFLRNWWNPVYHAKVDSDVSAMNDVKDQHGHTILKFENIYPNATSDILSRVPTLPNDLVDDLVVWSEEKLVEAVNPEVDLFNFTRELIELLVSALKALFKARDAGNKFMQGVLKAMQEELAGMRVHVPKHAWNDPVKLWHYLSPAQKFLIWKFVIAPFLKDLKGIIGSYNKAVKRCKWLQERNGLPTLVKLTRDISKQWAPEFEEVVLSIPHAPDDPYRLIGGSGGVPAHPVTVAHTRLLLQFTGEYELKYCCQGWVRFRIPPGMLDGLPGKLRVLAHMLGLDNPIGFLWEWLKFSWLIDWFLSYRARLWQRLFHAGPPGAEIISVGHSWHLEMKFKVLQERGCTINPYTPPLMETYLETDLLGHCVLDLYTRIDGLPKSDPVYFRSPWSAEHFVLIWAIFEQKVLRRRR